MALSRTDPPAAAVSDRWQRMTAPVLTIGGLAAATLALHVRDPHEQYSWGLCPSAALGFWCPGCGGLRAVNDLTHGDVGAALSSNLLLVLAIPFAVLALGLWAVDRWRGTAPTIPWQRLRPAVPVLVALAVAFAVARNLAFGSWLAP
ncbi:DUF2752 domain-containing protein [Nocardioides sp.]|uniref:DUF2752 domain-containing protein n=1 Tax=Nocardioides sp. TaxID=35761 RepID=UPI001A1FB8B5|nr:DUF2752 domain-containing protein [Nocardioides sp.]MBJ7356302.1 DUF2752 domain-containing protein [Nocardioides sp.]